MKSIVIPGLGRSAAKAESPESITPVCGYGFRARCLLRFAAPRN